MPVLSLPNGGMSPGTHALVIGVSHYPYLDGPEQSEFGSKFHMTDLSSAARSASEFAAWLLNEYRNPVAPLASLRVLLSPTDGETLQADIAGLLPNDFAATRPAVERDIAAIRTDARANRDNVLIVYVAGHGVQLNTRGAIVLLEDFAKPDPDHAEELYGSIDMAGCHSALNDGEIAKHQLWFSDACRQVPTVAEEFESLVGALRLSKRTGSVEASPLFLAASERETAFAEVGGLSLFCRSLLWALRGNAADGPDKHSADWYVGTAQLISELGAHVGDLAAGYGQSQNVHITGTVDQIVAQTFAHPPDVPVEISLVDAPDDAQARGSLLPDRGEPLRWDDWPLDRPIPAGIYALQVEAEPPAARPVSPVKVWPPSCQVAVELTQ